MESKSKKASTQKILCLLMAVVLITQITLIPAIGATAHEPENNHAGFYEAENGALGGHATVSDKEDASGGKMVGNIGGQDEDRGSVTFNDVIVEKAGLYEVTIYYATGDDRNFTISVNGEAATTLACGPTGGFDKVGPITTFLSLSEGSNSITFGSDAWGPDLDRIYISGNVKMYTEDFRSTMQAEDAQLFQGATADHQSNSCANDGKVSNIGGKQDGYVLFDSILIDQSGAYAIDIAYCTKENRDFLITVDGQQEIWVTCPAGYEWDVPNRCIVTCNLEAGTHSIQFSNPRGTAPNLDEIRLYPCQKYEMGSYTFLLDLETSRYNLIADGRTKLNDAYAAVKVGETLYRSIDYTQHELISETVQDAFGKGLMLRFINKRAGWPVLEQQFYLYEGQPYLLTDTKVYWESGETIGTNYIAPLYISSVGGAENGISGQDYFLRVPYDNDAWVEFKLNSINGSDTGYEAAAILDEVTGKAVVMGSLSHDIWKTGISYAGRQNQIDELQMYGGANGALTRDQSPHGTVTGQQVSSPLMFIGFYENWQDGMDAYAQANTKVTAPKMDAGSVPIGWNSWGTVQDKLNLETAVGISDYIHDNFQSIWKTEEDDVIYTVLDSYWDNMTDEELAEFVRHCEENGQKAGVYWTPFASWLDENRLTEFIVEGSDNVPYQDIILKKADGTYYGKDLDGALPIDMTHPAAQARVDYFIDRLKAAGFTYIKLDFLVHGALEGARYDPSIQTGTQAYNFGMQYVMDRLDGQMFMNLSIAPIFPYQYANGRRVACDAYYSIANTKYTLNGLTFGFWEKYLYQYPDPDHLVIWGQDGNATLEEGRSRLTSGLLLGTSFITGDNFIAPYGDGAAADARFKQLLTNPDIIAIAKTGKIFHPLDVNHLKSTSNMFTMTDGDVSYLAVLNYNDDEYKNSVDLTKLFSLKEGAHVKELWSGEDIQLQNGVLTINLAGKDSKVYRITPGVPDIQPGTYYYDAVQWAVDQSIIAGTAAFNPDASCTRAQMVTFLWRAAGSPRATGDNPFTDVQPGTYYYDAVLWAVNQGITAGTTANTFGPDATVTRAQAVTFLYRTAGSPATSGSSPFMDVTSDAYYTSAIQWAVGKGVTTGTTADTFSPDTSCTCAQIVTFLYRDRAN